MHKQPMIKSLFVLFCSAILCAADFVPISGDSCISWDDRIEPLFLKPFRETLKNSDSEFLSFEDGKIGLLGVGSSWTKGEAGNFSTVELANNGLLSSAKVCTTGNVRRLSLDINVAFDVLKAHFGDFVFSVPFFETEAAWGIFTSTGSIAEVTISATQDVTSKQCSASLDDFKFTSWGDIELLLRGDAGRNVVAETIFNANRARIVKFLSKIGVGKKINSFAQNQLSEALDNHSAVLCNIMASN